VYKTVVFEGGKGVLDLGCEFFKISNNVDVFLITNSTAIVIFLHFQEGGRGKTKRKVYSLYTHENVDNCE
jgi:hypothetical protein